MPRFGISQDEPAHEVVVAAFPNHTVVQVDVSEIGSCGGGIHCITQQQPA